MISGPETTLLLSRRSGFDSHSGGLGPSSAPSTDLIKHYSQETRRRKSYRYCYLRPFQVIVWMISHSSLKGCFLSKNLAVIGT